jgi:hypothetical protein
VSEVQADSRQAVGFTKTPIGGVDGRTDDVVAGAEASHLWCGRKGTGDDEGSTRVDPRGSRVVQAAVQDRDGYRHHRERCAVTLVSEWDYMLDTAKADMYNPTC